MENLQKTPNKEPKQSEECKTPIQDQKTDPKSMNSSTDLRKTTTPYPLKKTDPKSMNSSTDLRKTTTPYPLKVPKAFKYPERYRSPTDLMVSPVTKGLLARNRKGGSLLPPTINQPKVQDIAQDVVSFKIEI